MSKRIYHTAHQGKMTRQQGSASFLKKREEKKQPRMSELFGTVCGCFFVSEAGRDQWSCLLHAQLDCPQDGFFCDPCRHGADHIHRRCGQLHFLCGKTKQGIAIQCGMNGADTPC